MSHRTPRRAARGHLLHPLSGLRTAVGLVLLLGGGLVGCGGDDGGQAVIDADGDQWLASVDCDDGNPDTHPYADELCDGIDNDCDGEIDESHAIDQLTWFADADGDGFGDPADVAAGCTAPTGYVDNLDDCDDTDANNSPLGIERCDEVDNDCDGEVDEPGAENPTTYYRDEDGDGYGDALLPIDDCSPPSGYVLDNTDCDDTLSQVNPGAPEVCDEFDLDEDCDGLSDDEDDSATELLVWYVDADLDTHGVAGTTLESCEQPAGYAALDDDCDDSERTTNPSAREVCGDGVDNNCDGLTDGEDLTARSIRWYTDADEDGYGDVSADLGFSCDPVAGGASDPTDCDDADPTINPGVTETWYDGIDSDCAGDDDYDADADGYQFVDYGGEDCDDAAADIYPDRVDICGDGVDSDCDGVDPCDEDALLVGVDDFDVAGSHVAAAGDVDGDGLADILVGAERADPNGSASGRVYLWTGTASGTVSLDSAPASFSGEATGDHLGSATGVGDVDGDGNNDLLLGAYDTDYAGTDAGSAYLMLGPFSGDTSLALAQARLDGEGAGDKAGFVVDGPGDLDGDGFADLLVGAWSNDTAAADAGAAYVFRGPVTGTFALWTADLVLQGEQGGDQAGWAVSGVGDVDGDGQLDIAVGAPYEHGDADYRGAAYIVLGGAFGTLSLGEADGRLLGTNNGDLAGYSVSGGDVNGDGYADVVVGAPENDLGGNAAGAAYLVLGPIDGDIDLDTADLVMVGENTDDLAGTSIDATTDIDGDGRPDVVIGAAYDDSLGSNAGSAYIVLGDRTGSLDLLLADAKVEGSGAGDQLGAAVAGLGDTNGDGAGDVLIGAGFENGSGVDRGAAHLVLGGGWP